MMSVVGDTVLLLPALALVLGLMLVPGVYALIHSFSNWNPGYSSPFVGLANYRELFGSSVFREVLGNELFLLLGLPLWVLLPFGMAVLLHDRVKFAGVFRSVLLFPAVLSPAIIAILFRAMLAPDGLVNDLLRKLGLGGLAHSWIDSANLVKPTLIVLLAWASIGVGVIIFASALNAIPDEVLEASELDGATGLERMRFVIFPLVRHVVFFYAIFQVISLLLFSFGWIYVLTYGGPGYASTTMDFDIYQKALQFGLFGEAAAESVVLVGLVAGTALFGLLAAWIVGKVRK